MRRIAFVALSIAFLPTPLAEASDLPAVDELLDRFVDAVGGEDAFEEIDLRHIRGTIVQDLTWSEPTHRETPFRGSADW